MAFLTVNFISKSLMRTVPVNVILPADKLVFPGMPEPEDKPFKLMILLHGILGNYTDWVNGTRIQRWAEAKNLCVVMPSGDNAFYVDLPQSGNFYGKFIGEELPAMMRKMFHISDRREDCYIAGLSMGGFGTTYHALKYPQKFTYAYAMSPAVSGDMKGYVDAQADKSVFPAFTFEVGNQDTTVNNAQTKELADYMAEKGLTVEYIARDGIHYWDFWQQCLPKALAKAGESFNK